MNTIHQPAEEQFGARQHATERFYLAALDARKTGVDLRAQIRAGIEAVVDACTPQ
jgi:hypothetical protein